MFRGILVYEISASEVIQCKISFLNTPNIWELRTLRNKSEFTAVISVMCPVGMFSTELQIYNAAHQATKS
jgi:hypothetical protein